MATRAEDDIGRVLGSKADGWHQRFDALARGKPVAMVFGLMVVSNAFGTVFNVVYNLQQVAAGMTPTQRAAFETVAIPALNGLVWPVCMAAMIYLLWPLHRCLARRRAGTPVPPEFMEFCRRRLVNLPYLVLWVNGSGWLSGIVILPLVVWVFGGADNWLTIAWQFFVSFMISALITVAQTFFIVESFLTRYVYAEFFRDARPEQIRGTRVISYRSRLMMLWLAVAFMPLVALFVVLWDKGMAVFAIGLFITATGSSLFIFHVVGRSLLRWLTEHSAAVEEIGRGNLDVRIAGQRPDEWGRLSNHLNDMAVSLGRAAQLRETFGQFVSPELRDEIIARMPGLEVTVREITVVFADIRGFTRRCAGEPPERVGLLLNRFLTLALRAVEEKGGYVNKFLGDGFMALFGATRPRDDHADLALASAQNLLTRLHGLNRELEGQGMAPLAVGIGIHSGPALVGCFGATVETPDGRAQMRREFSAIGETVNFGQRIEQLTKTCGGPILLSEQTRCRLCRPAALECLGPQSVPGAPEPLVVHRAEEV